MCYVLVVGLPASRQEKWLGKLPNGVRSSPSYEELAPAMSDSSTFAVVKGMCACSLFNPGSYHAIIKKYRRKGWSEARIERTLADIAKNRNPFGLDGSLRSWLGDVADDTGTAYLFIHWISNRLDVDKGVCFSAEQIRDAKMDVPEEHVIHILGAG